jgi:hypothetical protein
MAGGWGNLSQEQAPKSPAVVRPPGLVRFRLSVSALEHAEYDSADKGEGDVSGHHAQSADEGTKGHRNSPELTSLPALSAEINNARFAKKGRLAVYPPRLGAAQSRDSWLKSRKIKALMSP